MISFYIKRTSDDLAFRDETNGRSVVQCTKRNSNLN